MNRAPQAPPFSRSLAWSAGAHGLLLGLLFLLPRLGFLFGPDLPPLEIEITGNILGDGAAKRGAPKPLTPGPKTPVNLTAQAQPEAPKPDVKPAEKPPSDWVLPGKDTKVVAAPPPPAVNASVRGDGDITTPGGKKDGTGIASQLGGSGDGYGDGEIDGTGHGGVPLSAFPKLINGQEVADALRHLYPESERRANRIGDVVLFLHIDAGGNVASSDVAISAGPAFDGAAHKVGKIMRFSPALDLRGRPVRVKLPQPIQFRLTD